MARHRRRADHDHPAKSVASNLGSPLRISIATYPQMKDGDVSIQDDLRLLKPALLYADEVTLYSPSAVMITQAARLATLSETERLSFLRQVYPVFEPELAPQVYTVLDTYNELAQRTRGRSREELLAYLQMRPMMENLRRDIDMVWKKELVPKMEEIMTSTGADQLSAVLAAGLVKIDPIIHREEDVDPARFVDQFVAKLAEMLRTGVYPLFDDRIGSLVRRGLEERLFHASALSGERGKQVAAATGFMGRLPAFPAATVADILDIRSELQPSLKRFRAAVSDLAKCIEAMAYDDDFGERLDEIYRTKVEPALNEIDDAVKSNSYLQRLVGKVVGDTKTLITAALAFGVAHSADLPQMLVAGGATSAQVLAQAAWEQQRERGQIAQQAMYFLYRTEQLLSGQ